MTKRKEGYPKPISERITDKFAELLGGDIFELSEEDRERRVRKYKPEYLEYVGMSTDEVAEDGIWEIIEAVFGIVDKYPDCDYPFVAVALKTALAAIEGNMSERDKEVAKGLIESHEFEITTTPEWLDNILTGSEESPDQ